MGMKSRGNYSVNICMKFDCNNREKECENCRNHSKYQLKKLYNNSAETIQKKG